MTNKDYYEVFEIHTMPRGIVALTLRINKQNVPKAPIGSLTIHIGTSEDKPKEANFINTRHLGFNQISEYTTKSFRIIHERIDAIRDALNHTNLDIFINDELIQPYKVGTRYMGRGIYLGVGQEVINNNFADYYKFHDNTSGEYKEYFNSTKNKGS